MHTPAWRDKHFWHTAFFVAVVVANHRLGLALTPTELAILAAVLGIYMGQSQLTAVARLKAAIAATPEETKNDGA